jgi:hypothetical protein
MGELGDVGPAIIRSDTRLVYPSDGSLSRARVRALSLPYTHTRLVYRSDGSVNHMSWDSQGHAHARRESARARARERETMRLGIHNDTHTHARAPH